MRHILWSPLDICENWSIKKLSKLAKVTAKKWYCCDWNPASPYATFCQQYSSLIFGWVLGRYTPPHYYEYGENVTETVFTRHSGSMLA